MKYNILCGNNLDVLKTIADNSIDACITDPPYGMEIADVGWDHDVPPTETWKEVLRVLKPGAFCLSFCSPELYHRMATKVDDAGFDIKDQILECFMYITVVGLGVTVAEKFATPK